MFVGELWRYPVKSMAGEPLVSVGVGFLGVEGDRRRAVVDADSGVALSAKRYGELLSCQAWTEPDGRVMVGLPDGLLSDADSPEVAEALSDLLDRSVLVKVADESLPVRHEFTVDTAVDGSAALVVDASTTGAFFDGLAVHLLTEATLLQLTSISPDSVFHRARFRPNILLSGSAAGFVEDEWVGGQITIGNVVFDAVKHKTRCVMTTRAQGNLNIDRGVLKTVVSSNRRRAGIELETTGDGTISVGDPVTV